MRSHARGRRVAAFTLAEALAALVFMAIVIPVAVQGLRVASLAGQVAVTRSVAARLADAILNELLVTGEWQGSSPRGVRWQDSREYRWYAQNDAWEGGGLRRLTVEVFFDVQGQEQDVRLSTLADPSATLTDTNTTSSASATPGGTLP